MRQPRIAALLVAVSLGVPCGPAVAQTLDRPTAAHAVPPRTAHKRKAAAKPAGASPSAPVAPLVGEDAGSSLERRRRAFFAKPDDGEAAPGGTAPVGVTLGGAGGITPGMNFKF